MVNRGIEVLLSLMLGTAVVGAALAMGNLSVTLSTILGLIVFGFALRGLWRNLNV